MRSGLSDLSIFPLLPDQPHLYPSLSLHLLQISIQTLLHFNLPGASYTHNVCSSFLQHPGENGVSCSQLQLLQLSSQRNVGLALITAYSSSNFYQSLASSICRCAHKRLVSNRPATGMYRTLSYARH